jgi:sugar phosphate isomerase/epimerase
MQVGVFAKTFEGNDPFRVLSACKLNGFDCTQYNMSCSGIGSLPKIISENVVLELKDAIRSTGISISAFSATYNMTDPNVEQRSIGRMSFEAIAKCAAFLGTPIVTVCSGSLNIDDKWQSHPDNANPESWFDMCKEFELLCEIAEKYNILIGVEPEPGNIVSSATHAAKLLESFSGSPIGIVLDPANLIEGIPLNQHRQVINESMELLESKIVLAHAKDRSSDESITPPGKGVIDWPYFLQILAYSGFDGSLVTHGIIASEALETANFLKNELYFLK